MKIIKKVILFIFLTLITQVGGIVYLISSLIYFLIGWTKLNGYKEPVRRISFHAFVYLLFTFMLLPPVASFFGRQPLPVFSQNNFGPRTIWTVVLNRHYVRPELKETALKVSSELSQLYPGIKINYFDANHPFYKGYPLLPHLSHDDGKKLDLGFIYNDAASGVLSNSTPSVIGYGISEEPNPGEYDRPGECSQNEKNWMYSFMRNIYPQDAKMNYDFNLSITKALITSFASEKNIQKILLEPHLKTRLHLKSGKIKPVQCGSVRHDDHFHIQIN